MAFIKKHRRFGLLFIFVLLWIGCLFFISPEEIVAAIGIETGYLILFLTAFIGVSGFASTPFYLTLFTLASSSEFNLLIVVLAIAPARAFGDSIFFLLGHQGHSALIDLVGPRLKKFSNWLNQKPQWLTFLSAYIYTSFTPFPQDLLMIALGLARVKFLNIFGAVLLGNATFIVLAYFLSNFAGRFF